MRRKYTPDTFTLSLFDGKRCWKCQIWHPFSNFHADPCRSDGRHSSCKTCRNAYKSQYYKEHPRIDRYSAASTISYRKQYRLNNLPRIKALIERWHDKHPNYSTVAGQCRRL